MAKSIRRVSLCFVLAIALVFTMMPLALQPAKAADRSAAGAVTMPASKTMALIQGVNTKINFGTTYNYDSYYYFQIKPTKTGYITVTSDYISGYNVALCNASKKLASRESKSLDDFYSAGSSYAYQKVLCYGVKKGKTYYIRVKGASGERTSDTAAYPNYSDRPFIGSIKWTNSAVKGIKYGKSKKKAVVLKKNKTRKGVVLAGVTKHQWYKIKTSKKKVKISFYAKNNCGTIYARVHYRTYGSHGKWLKGRLFAMRGDSHYKDAGTITKYTKKTATYYVEVYPDYKASGAYTLKWK